MNYVPEMVSPLTWKYQLFFAAALASATNKTLSTEEMCVRGLKFPINLCVQCRGLVHHTAPWQLILQLVPVSLWDGALTQIKLLGSCLTLIQSPLLIHGHPRSLWLWMHHHGQSLQMWWMCLRLPGHILELQLAMLRWLWTGKLVRFARQTPSSRDQPLKAEFEIWIFVRIGLQSIC